MIKCCKIFFTCWHDPVRDQWHLNDNVLSLIKLLVGHQIQFWIWSIIDSSPFLIAHYGLSLNWQMMSSNFQAMRSTPDSLKQIYISPGHRISIDSSVRVVKLCCKFRVPEPTRQVCYTHAIHLSLCAMHKDNYCMFYGKWMFVNWCFEILFTGWYQVKNLSAEVQRIRKSYNLVYHALFVILYA